MDEERYEQLRLGERGAMISIAAYVCLSFIKLLIGFSAQSEALKADGFNNLTDIIASIAVWIGLRMSQKPPDEDHPYGHWKAENIASLVASFIMVAVGLNVLHKAVFSIFSNEKVVPDMLAAWTGLVCAGVMYLVYRYNKALSEKVKSQSVLAAAKDNLSDAWVSIGAVIGIIGSQFHLPWLDPLAAIIVGLLICKTAYDIFYDSSHQLTDGFDEQLIEEYKESILNTTGVAGIKDIRARNYGNNTVVDIIIVVNESLSIRTAHDISSKVEEKLISEYDVYNVHVHVEPS